MHTLVWNRGGWTSGSCRSAFRFDRTDADEPGARVTGSGEECSNGKKQQCGKKVFNISGQWVFLNCSAWFIYGVRKSQTHEKLLLIRLEFKSVRLDRLTEIYVGYNLNW